MLVIDPDQELTDLIRERLEEIEMSALTADTGEGGLALARSLVPRLILTELDLPDMSGFQLIETIRVTPHIRSIPIIVLTERLGDEEEDRARKYGVNLFVRKPYRPAALFDSIKTLLISPEPSPAPAISRYAEYERLITQPLDIEVRTKEHLMRGITTGLNEKGIGMRVNVLEQFFDTSAGVRPGQPCTIVIRGAKPSIRPCRGTILRVEESRDRRYKMFLAVKYESGRLPDESRGEGMNILDWIKSKFTKKRKKK